ncbi:hypothetical protein [Mycetocola saprophilus]|uniref:hypothetical protein n=1 Tax=Mycetocola saprophilus TaxID=76636 RepID=UPI0012DD0C2C|nr:hypothetical protein [Mycetocola saprophilus]
MTNRITLSAAIRAERAKREADEAKAAIERADRRKEIEIIVRREQIRQFSERHRTAH